MRKTTPALGGVVMFAAFARALECAATAGFARALGAEATVAAGVAKSARCGGTLATSSEATFTKSAAGTATSTSTLMSAGQDVDATVAALAMLLVPCAASPIVTTDHILLSLSNFIQPNPSLFCLLPSTFYLLLLPFLLSIPLSSFISVFIYI